MPDIAPENQCFGGQPQLLLADAGVESLNSISMHFQIVDGALLWASYRTLHRLDLTTSARSDVAWKQPVVFKGAHGDRAFGVTTMHEKSYGNELVAIDLRTGEQQTLFAGRNPGGDVLWGSHSQIDGTDLYFIRGTPGVESYIGSKFSSFVRWRRDSAADPEFLGHEPQGTETLFLVDQGFVYWNRFVGKNLFELSRRPLAADATTTRLASTKNRQIALAIAHERVYYLDDGAIYSVPIDGFSEPVRHTTGTGAHATNLLVDRSCLYWTNDRAILRMRLDGKGPTSPETVADEANYRGGPIVTDGKQLYWFDEIQNRLMRAGRDLRALPPRPALVAKPIDLRALPPDSPASDSAVEMGDGLGCAKVFGWGQWRTQCWSAQSAESGFVQARPMDVPQAPGQASPTSRPLIDPTVMCGLQQSSDHRTTVVSCSGDNTFGQLATGHTMELAGSWQGAFGAWHGCIASRANGEIQCWGRGDAGQLGYEAGRTCDVGGRQIPCSHQMHKMDVALSNISQLVTGDMFTCAASWSGRLKKARKAQRLTDQPTFITGPLRCWGGSRDGWFGDTLCPPELRAAWPSLSDTLPAPQATCTRLPVEVPEFNGFLKNISVGPRGACASVDGLTRCVGAIPPPSIQVTRVQVGQGSQANACGIGETGVVCWGEGYSPAGDLNRPVPIQFAATTPARSAVIDFPPPPDKTWSSRYLINHGCHKAPVALPTCTAGLTGETWSSLAPRASTLRGTTVTIRDRLVVGPPADFGHASNDLDTPFPKVTCDATLISDPGTNSRGCFRGHRHMALGDGSNSLRLGDKTWTYHCVGDESRLCCNTLAFGQTVIATGVLDGSEDKGWSLGLTASVCEIIDQANTSSSVGKP